MWQQEGDRRERPHVMWFTLHELSGKANAQRQKGDARLPKVKGYGEEGKLGFMAKAVQYLLGVIKCPKLMVGVVDAQIWE